MSLNDTIRFLLSGGRTRQIRELYDLVRPLGLPGLRKIRIGNAHGDGGYVMVDDFDGITAALSLGIGLDISWDLQMAGMGVEIHQFDHTVEPPAEVAGNPLLHFNRCGIAGSNDPASRMRTIGDILASDLAGHPGDLILKIDIDGHEWEVFEAMPDEVLTRFRQICMEIHHPLARPSQRAGRERKLRVLRKLHKAFAPVHLHANNAGPVRVICGLRVPKLLELTYIRRDGQNFVECADAYPGAFDVPNVPSLPEIPIGEIVSR
jgi:hypothetical protein